MRYIVAFADLLMVEGTPWLLVQADKQLLDQLAEFEADVDDIEAEYEGDMFDNLEPDADSEADASGFDNPEA